MKALLKGLIIEGVIAAGKTTLIRDVLSTLAERRPACTKVFLSEHYTERVLEDKKARQTLTPSEVIEHSSSILTFMKQLALLKSSSKFETEAGNASIYAILERFLGSHFANLSAMGIWNPDSSDDRHIRDVYTALTELGFSVLILAIPEERIAEAIGRTRLHRNENWSAYLDSIGSPDDVERHFRNWQQLLLTFYRPLESVCPIRVLETVPSKDNPLYRQFAETWVQ